MNFAKDPIDFFAHYANMNIRHIRTTLYLSKNLYIKLVVFYKKKNKKIYLMKVNNS